MKELFDDFTTVSDQEWRNKLEKDLKGTQFNDLIWLDENQVEHLPFYRRSDLENIKDLKETQQLNKNDASWNIFNIVALTKDNQKETIDLINVSLANGADKIWITTYLSSKEVERWIHDNELAFDNLYIELKSSNFNFSEKISAKYRFDPISEALSKGEKFDKKILDFLTEQKSSSEFSNIKLVANCSLYKNAGANHVQELAYGLQHAVEYLDILTEKEIPLQNIGEILSFKVGIGNSYFTEIAKFRAFRFLINRIFTAYNIKSQAEIIGETSSYYLSTVDPYNNLLRETTQMMSAALSSCNSVICPSFDISISPNNEFGLRMARNIQIILKEESYFNKVLDPSAGSFYIEKLTSELIDQAWKKFIKLEKDGGLIRNYENGSIQREIEQAHEQRVKNLLEKERKMIGVNVYEPSVSEEQKGMSSNYITKTDYTALKNRNLSESYLKESKHI